MRLCVWFSFFGCTILQQCAYKADSPLLWRLLCGEHDILHLRSMSSDGLHHVVESCTRQRVKKCRPSPGFGFGPVL